MQVTEGVITKRFLFRVIRDNIVIGENLKASSLKILKENAKEVKKGMECGLILEGFTDLQIDDIICAYEIKITEKAFKKEVIEIDGSEVKDK
jgi:translation initiation factor IF-2